MIFECPYCGQSLEVDDEGAGQTVDCPTCHQPVIIPDPGAQTEVSASSESASMKAPPMYVPLQPLAPTDSKPLVKKRRGTGCGHLLILLIAFAAGAFGYAMFRFQESPAQVWNRLTTFVQRFIPGQPTPAPSPEE